MRSVINRAFIITTALLIVLIPASSILVSAAPAFTEYPVPVSGIPYATTGITAGPDGALWFVYDDLNSTVGHIGRITTTGVITTYQVPTSQPELSGITAGPDGALWFTEGRSDKIGRITTSGNITEYSLPPGTASSSLGPYPLAITAGPDGALWFTEEYGDRIGRITTSGEISEYALPIVGVYPFDITPGPDGALWFTEYSSTRIGRITTSGSITQFSTGCSESPYSCGAEGITTGPDGALWFTAQKANKIGRITTAGVASFYAHTSGTVLIT